VREVYDRGEALRSAGAEAGRSEPS
jgi:hypothetical protein